MSVQASSPQTRRPQLLKQQTLLRCLRQLQQHLDAQSKVSLHLSLVHRVVASLVKAEAAAGWSLGQTAAILGVREAYLEAQHQTRVEASHNRTASCSGRRRCTWKQEGTTSGMRGCPPTADKTSQAGHHQL